jgi:hypothetical protein
MVKLKIMKRVNKELELLKQKYGNDKVEVRSILENEKDPYVINVYKNKNLLFDIKIILPYDYPFKDPRFFFYHNEDSNMIATIDYFDFFKDCSIFYFYKKNIILEDHQCPCCYNALCNRQLNESLLEISKDIQKFGIQFTRLREKYFLKKYMTLSNNLNEDVINNLLSYI